jgi:type III restriction enzyme
MSFEVSQPILNSAYAEPSLYWYIQEGEPAAQREGRRPAMVFEPRDTHEPWQPLPGLLEPMPDYSGAFALALVNLIRDRVKVWREEGYPGVTRTTLELLAWWRRDGREQRLFFAQLEAAETMILLTEARADFLQGVEVPREDPGDVKRAEGYVGFRRHACKMATGAGKTTVMGMLAAWSILNKVNARSDARFSDVVLVVCPNVTIRDRLTELKPELAEASLYRTRDLVPPHLMPLLTQGRVIVTNWHVFQPQEMQQGGVSAKVVKAGVPVRAIQRINIGSKTTTAHGWRYMTEEELQRQIAAGLIEIRGEVRDRQGNLKKVEVETLRYVESDTALINRVLGREIGGKQNILVMNDEGHHAYRISRPEKDPYEGDIFGEEEEAYEFFREATVWVDGLDRIQKLRGINVCIDLSATPYYLGGAGRDTARPFPWVVSDFGLVDAIESGMVKIPQLAIRDTTGAEEPAFRNIWKWVMSKLSPGERGGAKGSPKPEAVLRYAANPIQMLGGMWAEETERWAQERTDGRPPVFIVVCKNTKIAKVLYEWLASDVCPPGVPSMKVQQFRNRNGSVNTIRVDSKVVHETDTGEAKGDEQRWMRFTLDTVGKLRWPSDRQGRPIYPIGFEDLAKKLGRPLHPAGRDVRCIVSVGMLTEGWDANTVTHIVGLRPFMSQLLCEQVVGRGLRRVSYDVGEHDLFTEEVATVFGVPFEVIPFKARGGGHAPAPKRHHVHAVPAKVRYEIRFPRVEGYTQAVRNRVRVDWMALPSLVIDPGNIPAEVDLKGLSVNNKGRASLSGPGMIREAALRAYRAERRLQELIFDLSRDLTRGLLAQQDTTVPSQALFPQVMGIVQRYVKEKIEVLPPNDIKDLFLAPYYGWLVEILQEAIRPDTEAGEAPEVPRYETTRGPGSTEDVSFWTSKDVREVEWSHVNYVVADTKRWEQSAAYYLDSHEAVDAFVKNAGLGFAISYLYDGRMHDYVPDFIVRLNGESERYLILETKGYDPLADVKRAAAERWVSAVNADGQYGRWSYDIARNPTEVPGILDAASVQVTSA